MPSQEYGGRSSFYRIISTRTTVKFCVLFQLSAYSCIDNYTSNTLFLTVCNAETNSLFDILRSILKYRVPSQN